MSAALVQKLATNIHNRTEWMEILNSEQIPESVENKVGFTNLHESVKTMILNASTLTNQFTESARCISCEDFFKNPNIGKSVQFLNTTLKEEYNCLIDIQIDSVTKIHGGCFLCNFTDTSSNFYFFIFPRILPLTLDPVKQIVIIQMKVSQGLGWSDKDAKVALKQGVSIPNNTAEFVRHIKNFQGTSAFFLSGHSIMVNEISNFRLHMTMHLLDYEAT